VQTITTRLPKMNMAKRNSLPPTDSTPSHPPPERSEIPRDHHTIKVVFVTGPRCPSGPPTMEDPNVATLKGPYPPPPSENRCQHTMRTEAPHQGTPPPPSMTHAASPSGGLLDLPAKRLNERLHQGGGGFDNHHTSNHSDHQPPDPTNHRCRDGEPEARVHAPNPIGRQCRSDLATTAE
jgi:hypothetical protein